ncbi:MAG: hypothetical protein WBJ58_07610 [Syntrophales bacterium]|jgi:uncharacterized Zn finger protein
MNSQLITRCDEHVPEYDDTAQCPACGATCEAIAFNGRSFLLIYRCDCCGQGFEA